LEMLLLHSAFRPYLVAAGCLTCLALGLLTTGCAKPTNPENTTVETEVGRPSWMPADPPVGFFIPEGLFKKSNTSGSASSFKEVNSANIVLPAPQSGSIGIANWTPTVHLYASPTTDNYLKSGGLDVKNNLRIWENF